jgi:hypothetical protein
VSARKLGKDAGGTLRKLRPSLALALALIAIANLVVAFHRRQHRPNALAEDLQRLRASNGLFMHPSVLAEKQVSVADTAYRLGVLAAAGEKTRSVWSDQALRAAAQRSLADSSVWGSWYVDSISISTSTTAPLDLADEVRRSLTPAGYFADLPNPSADTDAELAATAAALDVLSHARTPIPAEDAERIANWLMGRTAELKNPYQACNIARGLAHLHRAVPDLLSSFVNQWWQREGAQRRAFGSAEQVLDAYGLTCVLKVTGDGSRLVDKLRPQLGSNLSRLGDPFIDFHLAEAWRNAGGERTKLGALADEARHGLNETGAAYADPVQIGTVGNTLTVMRILNAAESKHRGLLSKKATAQLIEQSAGQSPLIRLQVAVLLRLNGQDERAFAEAAAHDVVSSFPRRADSQNAKAIGMAATLLDALGDKAPIEIEPALKADTAEQRYLGWLLAAHAPRFGARVAAALGPALRALPATLATPSVVSSLAELAAAVRAAHATGVPMTSYKTQILDRVDRLKGCEDFPQLYRSSVAAVDCDLDATLDAYAIIRIVS